MFFPIHLWISSSYNQTQLGDPWKQTAVTQTIAKGGEIYQKCNSYHNINWPLGKNIPSFSPIKIIRKIEATFRKKKRVLSIGYSKWEILWVKQVMTIRIVIKIIAINIYGAHRPGLVPSGLHDLSHLILPATLWGNCYYIHFTDEATDIQTTLPSS